ncbi:hypothetical protein Pla123a_20580 [Posidoniimonas polymericola]|uniref:DUF695 domain-containing protein n=1 Tax=Posidoniimonas polymericola TaxID=2528002 RepID=A0A5C5YRQ9_9BACT|nr:hypothetical protein [Posidoniimonas polymericola]TWT77397.1 hypothetical protein Pla123a_20580 [Posidoniimonas polymericola]
MGLFDWLFPRKPPAEMAGPEQAVIVYFQYSGPDLEDLFTLEERLEKAIAKEGVGEYDGNEVAVDGRDGYLYMYGPDADRLFEVVKPVLAASSEIGKAVARLRYGPPEDGVRETHVRI